jgi:DNA-binding transcriptional LysR family regulator
VDINQLEVLVAVAQERSFSRAAEVLGRTQPAVSQAISRLEMDLGEKLIDRSSKDGTLTAAGTVLVDYARQMLNLRQDARSAVKELADLHQGKVTLSANEHTVFFLLPAIERFRQRHPFIKVEVRRGVASRIPIEIIGREVELGVVSFKPHDPSVRSVAVGDDELVMIVNPEHRLAKRRSVSVKELGAETFVAHNAASPYRDSVVQAFEKYNIPLNIGIELPSLEAIKKLVRAGVGVALVPKLTAREELEQGTLVGLSVKELKLARRLHLVYRRNAVLSHAARAFLDELK